MESSDLHGFTSAASQLDGLPGEAALMMDRVSCRLACQATDGFDGNSSFVNCEDYQVSRALTRPRRSQSVVDRASPKLHLKNHNTITM